MQKSRANWGLRQALKPRTRRWRRRQVVGFYLFMLFTLLCTLGADHHGRHFWNAVWGVWIALSALWRWSRREPLVIQSLDDRAQLAHGVNFDELSTGEQKQILERYRVGRFLLYQTPDERQQSLWLHSAGTAVRFFGRTLPWLVAAYWAVWLWAPAGAWRDMLTDSPVLISWLVVFVISLPQVIVMWTEPDEIGEPRAILAQAPG